MKCWNCQNPLGESLACSRCGMPQPVGLTGPFEALSVPPKLRMDEGDLRSIHADLARRCHPDLFRAHRDDRVLSAAKSAMRALNDAFRTLRDPQNRLKYVLAATGHSQESTRTVPEGLQDSVQIVERVLTTIEEARGNEDRGAWEGEQDHLAALRVKADAAQERSETTMRALTVEWDAAVTEAGDDWPEMPEDWINRALTWAGERAYLNTLMTRVAEAGRWPAEVSV